MGKINTFIRLLNDRRALEIAIADNFSKSKLSHLLSDKAYIKYTYRAVVGKKLDLKNPKTFNEKLQWLKIYNHNPQYCELVDKVEVKKYIADAIGDEYVIPTLGVWNKFDDIDFDALPEQFVLKCTHDSGSTVICRDKATFDIGKAKAKLERKLGMNLFWHGREWPYKNLKPRIIAEQYMEDEKFSELRDYKLFCFGGKTKCLKVDYDRFTNHGASYFTPDGKLLPFGEAICPPNPEKQIELPASLPQMIELAEKLSANEAFVRVDFYEINGQIYFGELTFYPASGFGPFVPEEWDKTLGDWLELPPKA